MQRADVGMSQAGNHFGLALEALASGSVVGEMWRKNLDGDSAVEASIADPINLSHGARAERRKDLLRAHFGAVRQGHG